MKIVINRCFGGFGLSTKALYEYVKRKYGSAYIYLDDKKNYNHYFLSDTGYNDIDSHSVLVSTKDFGKDIREKITLDEFMEIVMPRLPDRHSKEYIQKIFQYFDLENNGKITARHLKKIAQEIGENLSDEELKEIMEEADRDGDGYIGFEDFYRIMKKRGDDPLEDWSDDEDQ